jgi:hypothetical protein
MYGVSSSLKETIAKLIENLFDKTALRFIGNIPELNRRKHLLIGFEQNINLANLFIQSMGNKYPNYIEEDVLKGLLSGAYNYLNILKNKTSNNIIQNIEGLAREARISGEKISQKEIDEIIEEELRKASSGLETIIASESTKTRNLGMTMDISRAAAADGEKDPVVGFAGINDQDTCEECARLFLMPDKVTPRLWKLSECSAGYFKRGDSFPSIIGLHPNCHHVPFNVPSNWGFDSSGHLTFIGIGHDELEKQRKG